MSQTKTLEFAAQFSLHRKRRKLSTVRLSGLSGISKTTLDNWQSGRALPSAPELEKLITTLELSAKDQRLLRRAVGLPRAIAHLPSEERPPLSGGLLRALRLRRGRTQSEVARALNIRQGTLAKWERSDDWPEADKLSQLCALLGASHQEAEAILSGIFLPLTLPVNATREALEHQIQVLLERVHRQPNDPLLDLAFFELESHFWLDADSPTTQELLMRTWMYHTNYLCLHRRYKEALPYAESMLRGGLRPESRSASYQQSAVILKAQALRGDRSELNPGKPHWRKAIAFLESYQAHVVDNECRAWLWMELTGLNIGIGAFDAARTCLMTSNAVPHPQCVRGTMGESALLTAHHLTRLGSPREALVLLDSTTLGQDDYSFSLLMDMRLSLYRAEALARLDDVTGALGALNLLYHQTAETGIEIMRSHADALFFQLTHQKL